MCLTQKSTFKLTAHNKSNQLAIKDWGKNVKKYATTFRRDRTSRKLRRLNEIKD